MWEIVDDSDMVVNDKTVIKWTTRRLVVPTGWIYVVTRGVFTFGNPDNGPSDVTFTSQFVPNEAELFLAS